jgi:DNA-binding CsgD family transcriptional regulator
MGFDSRAEDEQDLKEAVDSADGSPRLTGRQLEILALLKAGKANKEIAYELGIGVGTVKQHVVALFRKLKVTNRAMAISRGLDMASQTASRQARGGYAEVAEGAIELRPACVLSLAPETGADDVYAHWRRLQDEVMAVIDGLDATMVSTGRGIDVILGLHHARDDDAARALQIARDVFHALAEADVPWTVRAGLASGSLAASVHRCGGWTGETVAGRTIGRARALRSEAAAGTLLADAASQHLLAFLRRAEPSARGAAQVVPLRRPKRRERAPAEPVHIRLLDRDAERDALRCRIDAVRNGAGGIVAVVGEAGMGKTALGQAFAEDCRAAGLAFWDGRCSQVRGEGDVPTVAAAVARAGERRPAAVLIDDGHFAAPADVAALARLAALSAERPLLLVVAGRRGVAEALRDLAVDQEIRLGRLSAAAMAMLIHQHGGTLAKPVAAHIAELAHGVPLFAVELARAARLGGARTAADLLIPLTLLTLVTSRCDTFGLDRVLLRIAARGEMVSATEMAALWSGTTETLRQELDRGLRAGILVEREGAVGFAHPMIRAVLQRTLLVDGPWLSGASMMDGGDLDG